MGTTLGPAPAAGQGRGAPHSQTLDRGLRLLAALADRGGALAVGDLAGAVGLHRSVAYRLLRTLEDHRLVARDGDGRYRLGTGLVRLARGVAAELREAARPELERLAEATGATAVLTVAEGDEAVCVAAVEPRASMVHVAYRPGLRHPLTVAASGLAILAGAPAVAGERADVGHARRRGYARTAGELQPGTVGVAAPVGVPVVASVGAVFLAGAVDEEAVVVAVRRAASSLTATMV